MATTQSDKNLKTEENHMKELNGNYNRLRIIV